MRPGAAPWYALTWAPSELRDGVSVKRLNSFCPFHWLFCRDLSYPGADRAPADFWIVSRRRERGWRCGSRPKVYTVSILSGSGRGRSVARALDRI